MRGLDSLGRVAVSEHSLLRARITFPCMLAVVIPRVLCMMLPECQGCSEQPLPRRDRAEGTQLLLQGMGSDRQLGWQEAAMPWDLSCPSASQFLSCVHWRFSASFLVPAWQYVCRTPSGPDTYKKTMQGHRARGRRRAELFPLLSPATRPSL